MNFFQPDRSELTLVFTYKTILAYLQSFCHDFENSVWYCGPINPIVLLMEETHYFHVAVLLWFNHAVLINGYTSFDI